MKRAAAPLLAVLAWASSSACTGATGTSALSSGGATSTHTAGTGGATSSSTTTPSGGTGGQTSSGPIDFCKACSLSPACTPFSNGAIVEASGIASSAAHAGVYYVHNDSGDTPRFFATNCAGEDLGTFEVTGATAIDWEDIARAPCDGKECLYFGDIGDNDEIRSGYAIYRVEEPASLGAGVHTVASVVYPFVYPDGSHNSEALLIRPTTGEMVVVTKVAATGASGVYAFPAPLTPGQTATLIKVGEVTPPSGGQRITAGDVHPQAQGVLLRTYTSLFFYPMSDAQPIATALAGVPCEVPVTLEVQGEAVAFTPDGTGYVTVSETSGQRLHPAACKTSTP